MVASRGSRWEQLQPADLGHVEVAASAERFLGEVQAFSFSTEVDCEDLAGVHWRDARKHQAKSSRANTSKVVLPSPTKVGQYRTADVYRDAFAEAAALDSYPR